MTSGARTGRARNGVRVALAVAVLAAVATAVAGFVLAQLYQPHPSPDFVPRAPTDLRVSDRWRDAQLWAGVVCLLASLLVVVLAVRRRAVLIATCAGGAALAALVTLFTRELVAWDQLGLWSVTVGTDISGFWTAAFGDEVRFVLVGGTEVSKTTYGAVLLVHLAAPVLGAVALIGAAVAARRPPPIAPAVAPLRYAPGSAPA